MKKKKKKNIPNLLPIADIDIFLKLRLGAEVAIYFLSNKDGFESCEAENDSSSQKAVYNGCANLGFYKLAYPCILKWKYNVGSIINLPILLAALTS